MSDMQLALLALGALIILLVIGFNWWQERRFRHEASQRLSPPPQDALLDDANMEPAMMQVTELNSLDNDPDNQPANESSTDNSLEKELRDEVPFYIDESQIDRPEPLTAHEPANKTYEQQAAYEPPVQPAYTVSEHNTEQSVSSAKQAYAAAEANDLLKSGSSSGIASIADIAMTPAHTDSEPQLGSSLPASVHHQMDLTALLFLQNTLTGTLLRQALQSIPDLDKPVICYGLAKDGLWYLPSIEHEHSEFMRIACSLQLADRSGPVSRQTLDNFLQAIAHIGAQLNAQIEWHGPADPISHAGELDQFCAEVDVMVGFHLVQGANGPFAGTKLRGLAEAAGLSLGADGGFHCLAENQPVLYSVFNQDKSPFSAEMLRTTTVSGITFQLDFPRVKNSLEVFNQMVLLARQMENSLNADLVDDKQHLLGDPQIEKIRQQLKIIHARLVTRGILPGSASALRLFS